MFIVCSDEKARVCWLEPSDNITDPTPPSDKLSAVSVQREKEKRLCPSEDTITLLLPNIVSIHTQIWMFQM